MLYSRVSRAISLRSQANGLNPVTRPSASRTAKTNRVPPQVVPVETGSGAPGEIQELPFAQVSHLTRSLITGLAGGLRLVHVTCPAASTGG